jgi:hypothetical protein
MPAYISGQLYRPWGLGAANAAVTAGTLYSHPLMIWSSMTVRGLYVRVVTGVASTNCMSAIYSNVSGLPGTLLGYTASASTASSASNAGGALVGGNLTLAAGMYWAATICNGAPTLFDVVSSDAQFNSMVGTNVGTSGNLAGTFASLSGTGTFGSFNSSYGSVTYSTGEAPLVFVQAN